MLALAPLARAGLIADVVVDAKSGVSGAGRAGDRDHALRHRRRERQRPTASPAHRHAPEIDQELARSARRASTFMPHLVPLDQGELVSCYVTPRARRSADELRALYEEAYADEPFVELAERAARRPRRARDQPLPHLTPRSTRAPAGCSSFAAIDNLWKGAASQAVQNLNLMFGRPEGEGIA